MRDRIQIKRRNEIGRPRSYRGSDRYRPYISLPPFSHGTFFSFPVSGMPEAPTKEREGVRRVGPFPHYLEEKRGSREGGTLVDETS